MSGSDMNDREVAQGVFQALHPHCPAMPGEPNYCAHQVCDCGNCEDIPGQVRALRQQVESLTAAIAAMQPPTETRWMPKDRSKEFWSAFSAAPAGRRNEYGRRAMFFADLRDFADGVSDDVLERAYFAATDTPMPAEFMRSAIRALADQEEGRPHV